MRFSSPFLTVLKVALIIKPSSPLMLDQVYKCCFRGKRESVKNDTICSITPNCFRKNTFSYPIPPATLAELQNVQYHDTHAFVPPIHIGKVIKVYDGDTITIASKYPGAENSPMYRFSVRLNGIDSAEIKGKTVAEKEQAVIARDALSKMILNKIVTLKNLSTEKYGRLLAEVYLDDLHLNAWMLEHNYAVPYDGGTKHRPAEWDAGTHASASASALSRI
jgi:endonuclease YncB( thermonuclease family)